MFVMFIMFIKLGRLGTFLVISENMMKLVISAIAAGFFATTGGVYVWNKS